MVPVSKCLLKGERKRREEEGEGGRPKLTAQCLSDARVWRERFGQNPEQRVRGGESRAW